MSRKMKNLSARIVLDFVAFLAISMGFIVGRAVARVRKDRDRMI